MQLIDLTEIRHFLEGRNTIGVDLARRLVYELEYARGWMRTCAEVYPVAVDRDTNRIWVLDPSGPWSSRPVGDDSEPDAYAKHELLVRGAYDPERGVLHQTSDRTEITEATGKSFQVDTFLAAVPLEGPILADWPRAEPITEALLAKLGPPAPHGAMEVPWVSDGDVLQHGLGIFAELMGDGPRSDPETATKLEELGFREPLAEVEEAMFKHFRRVHQAA